MKVLTLLMQGNALVPKGCCNAAVKRQHVVIIFCVCAFQSCEVMAAASTSRPGGGAQTTEKSQLILKGNDLFVYLLSLI